MTSSKNQNKAIWIAGLATLLANFQLIIFNNYVVIYLQEDLLTAILIITIIIALRNLLQLFFRVPLGELSQIVGRKPLLLMGHFSYAFALILMFIANSWFFVLISTIFIAFGMSSFWPALFAYVSDFTPDDFGESNGRIFQMGDIGAIFSSLIAAILLDQLSWELHDLFGVVAGIGILSGLVTILVLPEGLEKRDRKQVSSVLRAIGSSFTSMIRSINELTRVSGLTQVYFFQLILAFTEFMATTFLPVLIVQKGYSRGDISEFGLWATLVIIWFKPRLGKLTDRIRFSSMITFTILLLCVTVVIFTIVQNYWVIVILFIILNGTIITAYIAENNEASRRAPFALRGTALGALGFYTSLGRTTSTIVLGPIWEFAGLLGVFYFTALIIGVVTLLLFLFTKRNRSKIEISVDS